MVPQTRSFWVLISAQRSGQVAYLGWLCCPCRGAYDCSARQTHNIMSIIGRPVRSTLLQTYFFEPQIVVEKPAAYTQLAMCTLCTRDQLISKGHIISRSPGPIWSLPGPIWSLPGLIWRLLDHSWKPRMPLLKHINGSWNLQSFQCGLVLNNSGTTHSVMTKLVC